MSELADAFALPVTAKWRGKTVQVRIPNLDDHEAYAQWLKDRHEEMANDAHEDNPKIFTEEWLATEIRGIYQAHKDGEYEVGGEVGQKSMKIARCQAQFLSPLMGLTPGDAYQFVIDDPEQAETLFNQLSERAFKVEELKKKREENQTKQAKWGQNQKEKKRR